MNADSEVEEEPGEGSLADVARRARVSVYGPRCSAWLVGKYRRQFRLKGVMEFVVPDRPNKKAAAKLLWFFVAMDFLRARAGWAVDVQTAKKKRTYRVRWLRGSN
jgi:hypothetical protein